MTIREDQMLYTLQHARNGELLRDLSQQLTEFMTYRGAVVR